jgi:hypothetical protein
VIFEHAGDAVFPGRKKRLAGEGPPRAVGQEVDHYMRVGDPRPVLVDPERRHTVGRHEVRHPGQMGHQCLSTAVDGMEGLGQVQTLPSTTTVVVEGKDIGRRQ